MSNAIVDQPSRPRLQPSPVQQPGRRSGNNRGPRARPVQPAPSPPRGLPDTHVAGGSRGVVPPYSNTRVRACRVRTTRPSASWHLTDRGIAVVLALAAMIVLAAVTVIGLTAWRVTGPEYQAGAVSQLSQR